MAFSRGGLSGCESLLETDNLKEWGVVSAAVELVVVCFVHLLLPTGF